VIAITATARPHPELSPVKCEIAWSGVDSEWIDILGRQILEVERIPVQTRTLEGASRIVAKRQGAKRDIDLGPCVPRAVTSQPEGFVMSEEGEYPERHEADNGYEPRPEHKVVSLHLVWWVLVARRSPPSQLSRRTSKDTDP